MNLSGFTIEVLLRVNLSFEEMIEIDNYAKIIKNLIIFLMVYESVHGIFDI
ncbi:hypothetical protein SDC9_96690 [bioreactor metagenome]|uniref:Uncharacterized protein n=1 Tax=bioreactor metagenome TaxID=1076179 RepID=A0A645AAK7_9ZZZZ